MARFSKLQFYVFHILGWEAMRCPKRLISTLFWRLWSKIICFYSQKAAVVIVNYVLMRLRLFTLRIWCSCKQIVSKRKLLVQNLWWHHFLSWIFPAKQVMDKRVLFFLILNFFATFRIPYLLKLAWQFPIGYGAEHFYWKADFDRKIPWLCLDKVNLATKWFRQNFRAV